MRLTSAYLAALVCPIIALLVAPASDAWADERVCNVRVGDLQILEGTLADEPRVNPVDGVSAQWTNPGQFRARQPYVVLDSQVEGYLAAWSGGPIAPRIAEAPLNGLGLFVRTAKPLLEVQGTLFRPSDDFQKMVPVRFRFDPSSPSVDHAESRFFQAKADHYRRLLTRQVPGAAWFRHEEREALTEAGGPERVVGIARPVPTREDSLDRTLEFFGGSRAIRENLQLDRTISEGAAPGAANGPQGVSVDSLKGITVAEIDWSTRIAGKTPELDPLAAAIPADQHAVFLPDLNAVADLFRTLRERGSFPALRLAPGATEDAGLLDHYQQELAIGIEDLSALAKLGTIRSLALTGSDPYFEDGTDVALVFETSTPDRLVAFLRERYQSRKGETPDAELRESDEPGGIHLLSIVSPEGELRSFSAVAGPVVVVTNSAVQRDRVLGAIGRSIPSLRELPEYVFFRDRYKRGEGAETAFVVLSDATIRRWCGPRWRIGASRRSRAAAWLAELQTEHVPDVVQGRKAAGITAPTDAPSLGALTWSTHGVVSSLYGRSDRLKPLIEVPIETVTPAESAAYDRWRGSYQRYWRGVFDPIAIRLSTGPDRFAADLSVMPLIAASDYAPLLQLTGSTRIPATAGDPHPEALFHAIVALDRKAPLFQQGDTLASTMFRVPAGVGLSWVGSTAAVYLDDDPFWGEVAKAGSGSSSFLTANFTRVPVGVHLDVTDPAKLALFLGGLRAFLQESAPDALTWSTRQHGEKSYACVTATQGIDPERALQVFYATTPRALFVTLSESMMQRFLDRQANAAAAPSSAAWLGESVAARVTSRGLRALNHAGGVPFREQLQLRSWDNLLILNEWKRLYPERDPVAVHHALWGVTLVCPGGGRYVWNDAYQTMESTVFGCPAQLKDGPEEMHPLAGIDQFDLGVTFSDGGLRGRIQLDWSKAP